MVLFASLGEGCFHRLDAERIPCDPANAKSCPADYVCTSVAEGYRCRRPSDASIDAVPLTGETGLPIDAIAGEAGKSDGKAIDGAEAGGGEVSGSTRLDADLDGTSDTPIGVSDGGRFDAPGTGGTGGQDAPLTPPADGASDVPQSPGVDGATGGTLGSGGVLGSGGAGGTGGSTGTGVARTNGSSCLSGADCDSGKCADGVCCDGTCGGCSACLQAMTGKSDGTCAPVLAGVDPHELCADETATNQCGNDGACDGKGACRKVGTNHVCTPGACNTGSFTPASTCDGLGACKTVTPVACGASPCSPTDGCQTTCTTDANCVGDSYCDSTKVCKAKKNDGDSCAEGRECSSTYCIDGVCCNTTCGGCNACSITLTGQASGTCAAAKVQTDPHDVCAVAAPPCGQDGFCDGAGACWVAPSNTPCGAESCTGNLYTPLAKCTGTGTCGTVTSTVCGGNLLCGGATCKTACGSNADCVSGFACPVGGGSACGVAGCGDGTVSGTDQCDDGNPTSGDGCNDSCQTEPGWTCTGSGPGSCVPTCGDGIRVGTEQCDDGNAVTTDGCNACALSPGWACEGSPSVCLQVIYVNAAATGANDGTSWANAYTSLTTALAAATAGKQIWVAQGTYKPSSTGDRGATFSVGVSPVYGGFLGVGREDRSERDWIAHKTVLSGDLNGDDGTNFANNTDNSYHILYAWAGSGGDVVLDGLHVRNGNANVADLESERGAALYVPVARTLSVAKCVFENNSATYGGAAVWTKATSGTTIRDSVFQGNRVIAGQGGGGVWTDGPISISACRFEANIAASGSYSSAIRMAGSGAIVIDRTAFRGNAGNAVVGVIGSEQTVNVTIGQTIFENNDCKEGSVAGIAMPPGSSANLTNVLFRGNICTGTSGRSVFLGSFRTKLYLRNVTVVGGTSGSPPIGAELTGQEVYAYNSILRENTPGSQFGTTPVEILHSNTPTLMTGTGNTTADPLLDATGIPASTSPVINAGNNTYLPADTADVDNDGDTTEVLPLDLAGNARVQGGTVDMGAYEVK